MAALQRFYQATTDFDLDAYTTLVNGGSETVVDPAARKAVLQHGIVVIGFRQVKRRDRQEVVFEAGRNLINGYNHVRYLLGTWHDQISYSTHNDAEANGKRLLDLMNTYPPVDIMMDSVSSDFSGFALDLAKFSAQAPILQQVFGSRQAEGITLTFTVDGMHLALAEADEFLSKSIA